MTSATDRPDGSAGQPAGTEDGGTFADLGLRDELLTTLAGLGYEEPTPIQRETVPPLVEGRDLQGQAATGTGKTAAFALPVLQRLPAHRRERPPIALVLVHMLGAVLNCVPIKGGAYEYYSYLDGYAAEDDPALPEVQRARLTSGSGSTR